METNNNEYCVYVHINKINGKMYIGQTCQKPEHRWNNGNGYNSCPYFYKAIKKYGWNNFEHEVIASCLTKEEANNLEKLLIKILNTQNKEYGYNICDGGNNQNSRRGIKHSEETKQKIGDSNRGKRRTLEQKIQMGEIRKGQKRTEEQRINISKGHIGKYFDNYDNIRIAQYDKNGSLIQVYNTVYDASISVNICQSAIDNCLANRAMSCAGFMWRYIDKNNVPNIIDSYPRRKPYTTNTKELTNALHKYVRKSDLENQRKQRVGQYDKNDNLIREWSSMTEAAKALNIGVNNIWKCCNHIDGRKTAGGFVWQYIKNRNQTK